MKTKLIKLTETHYIIVDDSEIKEGDYCLYNKNHNSKNINEAEIIKCGIIEREEMYPISDGRLLLWMQKITHSTQPLEQYYGATDGTIPFVYHKIKPLSISEVEELVNGYSVEKMAYKYREEKWKGYFSSEYKTAEKGFIDGFNVHKELVKDKLFTVEQLEYLYNLLTYDDLDEEEKIESCKEYIKSLLLPPKTQWKVEITPEGKLKLVK